MNPICSLKCDAFCDEGDEENCHRYKEYRDELLKHCIAVYEQKIRAEAIDECIETIKNCHTCEIIMKLEQLKEQK